MSSAHNSDNEESIPSAPVFCKRLRTEDLQSEVAKSTREGIEQLYQDVIDKLDTNKKDKKDAKEQAIYTKMIQQAKLVESIDDFFVCEEKISSIEKTLEDLRENEEHTNDVIYGYKDSEEDYKNRIKKLKDRVIVQESCIIDMKRKIKTKNTYLLQIVLVFGAYVLYHLYP